MNDKKEPTLAERFPNEGKVIPRIPGAPEGTSGLMSPASYKQQGDIEDRAIAGGAYRLMREHLEKATASEAIVAVDEAQEAKPVKFPRRCDM